MKIVGCGWLGMEPPQTIISVPVQAAAGDARPCSGDCGSAVHRLVAASYASPCGGGTRAGPKDAVECRRRAATLEVA